MRLVAFRSVTPILYNLGIKIGVGRCEAEMICDFRLGFQINAADADFTKICLAGAVMGSVTEILFFVRS